jgi:hypothetical protein
MTVYQHNRSAATLIPAAQCKQLKLKFYKKPYTFHRLCAAKARYLTVASAQAS